MFICAFASSTTEQKICDYAGEKKREGNRALAMYMYFTQEKTNLRDCTLS